MKFLFTFIFSLYANFALLPNLFAQIGPDPNYTEEDMGLESDTESEADEKLPLPQKDDAYMDRSFRVGESKSEGDEVLAEGELEPGKSNAEIRSTLNYGVGVNLGVTQAWQKYTFNFAYFAQADSLVVVDLGGGDNEFQGEKLKKSYRLKSTARSLVVGWRYYFLEAVPFYLQPGLGYVLLKGDLDPTGSSEGEDEEEADKLRASYSAGGVIASLKIGITSIWENGFFVDYCLVGGAKTWLVSSSYTHASSEAKSATKHELQEPAIWGLVNIGVGKFF